MVETILNVPLLHQPKGTSHCAVATMRMLMAYNGENLSHDEAIKSFPDIDKTRVGITPATARFLVESGYSVTYMMHQKELIDDSLENKTEHDLEALKNKLGTFADGSDERLQWEQIIKFIEAGGKFLIKSLTLVDIDTYIEKGIPLRIGVKPSILHSDLNYKFNHAVVITGMREDEYLINDPSPKSPEPYWVKKGKVLEAWQANGSMTLIAIKNRY